MLTYLQFHLIFILPPIVLLWWAGGWHPSRRFRIGMVLITAVAVLYTTPWDNYLIARDVWWYGPDTVLFRIGYAPIGEYLFFALQPVLTGLWLSRIAPDMRFRVGDFARRPRVAGAAAAVALTITGIVLLQWEWGLYLGAILVWALPLIGVQWAVGGGYLWRQRRALLTAFIPPTLYLWAVDAIAIYMGIWQISTVRATGLRVGWFPIEEAIFFMVTNALVIAGVTLFVWVCDLWGWLEPTQPQGG